MANLKKANRIANVSFFVALVGFIVLVVFNSIVGFVLVIASIGGFIWAYRETFDGGLW